MGNNIIKCPGKCIIPTEVQPRPLSNWIYSFTGVVGIILGVIILLLVLLAIRAKVTAKKSLTFDLTRNQSYATTNCTNDTALNNTIDEEHEYEHVMYNDSSQDCANPEIAISEPEQDTYAEVRDPDLQCISLTNCTDDV